MKRQGGRADSRGRGQTWIPYLLAALSSLHAGSIRGAFVCAAGVLALVFLGFPYHSVWLDQKSLFGLSRPWELKSYAASLNPGIFLYSSESFRWNELEPGRPLFATLFFVATYAAWSILLLVLIGWSFRRMRSRR